MDGSIDADIDAIQRIEAVPRILEVVCRTTGMGFAAVARVTDERWVCCAVRDEIAFGLVPGGELKVETTLCHEVRREHQAVIIDHVAEDCVYADHHTPAMYGFQSYISMPIMLASGEMFGTLCAIDPRPARLDNPQTIGTFKLFAELIGVHLDTLSRLAQSEASLLGERQTAELREQFIAVLGHDLRNPLASIAAGARMLEKAPEKTGMIVPLMQDSVGRMSALIDDVLDFARGRLGGGLGLQRRRQPVEPVLRQVVAELGAIYPDRTVACDFELPAEVNCDSGRIAQLFSNLLGNALTHGAVGEPVRVQARTSNGWFVLSIANAGPPIPAGKLARLFQPFSRGGMQGQGEGLGLGLYIASEIARAHGGKLTASSTPDETCFSFRMPIA